MSVKIPSSFDFNLDTDVDLSGKMDLGLSGIPNEYGISIRELPTLNINLAPIEFKPIDFSVRIKEIPSIRAHLPLDYKLGFAFFGAEVASIRLCGQGQAITEPYVPNPCERRMISIGGNTHVVQPAK